MTESPSIEGCGKQKGGLQRHWTVSLQVCLDQFGSGGIRFRVLGVWWQVENLSTQVTSVVCSECLSDQRQQAFHVELCVLVIAHVGLMEMAAQESRFLCMSTHQACRAQLASYLRKHPQVTESSVCKQFDQLKSGLSGKGRVQ